MTHEQITELRKRLAALVINTGGYACWTAYRPHVGDVVDYVAELLAEKDDTIQKLNKVIDRDSRDIFRQEWDGSGADLGR